MMRSIAEIEADLKRFASGRAALAELQKEIDVVEQPVLLELEEARRREQETSIKVRRAAIQVSEKDWFYHRLFIARYDVSGERGRRWLADLKADTIRVLSHMDVVPQQKTYFAKKTDLQAAIALALNAYLVGVADGESGVPLEGCVSEIAQIIPR